VDGNGIFSVQLENPNNGTDENTVNDLYTSYYDLPPVYPGTIVIHFKTNKMPEQNKYQVFDTDGNVVFEKGDFEKQTLYIDTLTLLNGIYDFFLWDTGDNGISFWANSEGSGYLKFYDMNGDLIKIFQPDFGDRIYHNFYMDMTLGSGMNESGNLAFEILPNPSDGRFTISYALKNPSDIRITVINTSGQIVYNGSAKGNLNGNIPININKSSPGIYTCIIESGGIRVGRKFVIK
jgi:hypothetical protein